MRAPFLPEKPRTLAGTRPTRRRRTSRRPSEVLKARAVPWCGEPWTLRRARNLRRTGMVFGEGRGCPSRDLVSELTGSRDCGLPGNKVGATPRARQLTSAARRRSGGESPGKVKSLHPFEVAEVAGQEDSARLDDDPGDEAVGHPDGLPFSLECSSHCGRPIGGPGVQGQDRQRVEEPADGAFLALATCTGQEFEAA